MRGIIEETNLHRPQHRQTGFLKSFQDRRAPRFYFIEERLTFQVECLYKSFKDCIGDDDHDSSPRSSSSDEEARQIDVRTIKALELLP